MNEFATMKDIGAAFGMTSHKVGKLLKEQGLRTADGRPSQKSFDSGLVAQKFDECGHYLWSWKVATITSLLEQAGYNRKATDKSCTE